MSNDTETPPLGWARPWATARPYARPMPRAGAWYPVVGEANNDRIVLEIRGKKVAIQKKFLEVREKRPETFTAVVRSRATVAMILKARGEEIQRTYAVCPNCMNRIAAFQGQAAASCKQCGHAAEIAWWETG
jgi:hypothetical protein